MQIWKFRILNSNFSFINNALENKINQIQQKQQLKQLFPPARTFKIIGLKLFPKYLLFIFSGKQDSYLKKFDYMY